MKYNNIINQFNGSVWAIEPAKLSEIINFMESVSADKLADMAANDIELEDTVAAPKIENGIATLPVHGTIAKRMNLMTQFSGGTSTEQLTEQIRGLEANDDVKAVVLDVDSPGGSVEGLSEVAEAIRSLRSKKKVVAVANEMMASAAYWIGSAADEVYATPNASVGSIGVYMVRPDTTEADAKEGVKYNIIKSTPMKALGHPSEPLSEDGVKEFQRLVDAHANEFIRNVSLNRNITMEKAKEMADGRTHVGADAETAGLVDGVKTLNDIAGSLAEDATYEQKFAALSQEYTALEKKFQDAVAKLEKVAEAQALAKAEDEARRVEAAVTQLVEEDRKVAPMNADKLRERLLTDYEGTMATFELMPEAAAQPKEFKLGSPDKEVDPLAKKIADAKAKGIRVAENPIKAKVYKDFGYDFIKGYEE